MNHKLLSIVLIALLVLLLSVGSTAAQRLTAPGRALDASVGTGFTYQGYLEDGGSPANSTYDFRFRLYDAASAGGQVGSDVAIGDVAVADGLFTVSLDFGSSRFDGSARWLEVSVRPGSSTGAYTTLTPRQALTPAPYALALPGLWTQPGTESPNLIGGYGGNLITDGVNGGTIGGGGAAWGSNRVTDNFGTVGGGANNQAGDDAGVLDDAEYATIGGGFDNTASNHSATVAGGNTNTASGENAVVGGGVNNTASDGLATVGGGGDNSATGASATVGGGYHNTASGMYNPTIAGGANNLVSATDATVGGGSENTITSEAWAATISGGYTNTVTGTAATIGGGFGNTASSDDATVAGGNTNTASGIGASVPGGGDNVASGDYSFAAGQNAQALNNGSFVWADSTGAPFTSTADNQFAVRASGGVNFDTGSAPFMINGASPGPYANVVVVAKSGGDFTTIQAALNSITDASASNPYLVWVAPGVYSERVTMKEWVDIEGSGEQITRITYTGSATIATGTVGGANNAELRFLTVENTGGDDYAIAIKNNSTSPRLTHLTISASGGATANIGVDSFLSSVTMIDVRAFASGGDVSYGVRNQSSSSTMTNMTVYASEGTFNYGVQNDSYSPVMNNVTASASGGDQSVGLENIESSPIIHNSVISASGGVYNYGISNAANSGTYIVTMNNSQIVGSTGTIANDSEFTVLMGASLLAGGPITGTGIVTCAGVYDENYTFYSNTCP